MSRYVNLDEEIKAMYFDEEHEEWNLKEETIESALNHVDYYNVFELIQCKDCKFNEKGYCINETLNFHLEPQEFDGGALFETSPGFFCAYGKRKEE